MQKRRLGCLAPSAIIAVLLTLLTLFGVMYFSGNALFMPGSLNAQVGEESLGGVNSHAQIGSDCARCHTAPWEKETLGDRCVICHAEITGQLADPASLHGVLMKNKAITCRDCHSDHHGPNAPLTKMTGGDFPHAVTGYYLLSHKIRSDGQPFTCADCHADDITSFDPGLCSSCHQKMDAAFVPAHTQDYGPACRECHDGMESIDKNYDHNRAAFKLDGEHQGLACEKCHLNAKTASDFKALAADCNSCHLKDDTHKGDFGPDCSACHKASAWQPATFDHNLSDFKLLGKHTEAKCTDCHKNKVFKGTPQQCAACHAKDDQHAGKFGQDCAACHTVSAWKPATFNHDLSDFKLEGAHVNVTCTDCHKNNVFKGTPTQCGDCHADPPFHAGLFRGQTCAKCHSVRSWSPASFNLPHPEPQTDEGGSGINHGGATCRDCHTVNLNSATCLKCHDKNNPGN